MTLQCFQSVISGKVQGVWFRASTQAKATELGLNGWVKNLPDGNVAVYACGEADQLAQLKQWLQHGPPLAQVARVEYVAADLIIHDKFVVIA